MLTLSGIFPPLPTSFDQNQEVALDKIQENIKKLSKYKLAGFLILGSNGELVMLSDQEKSQVYQAARKAIPKDKIMIAGTGGQSTRETTALTKAAADSGADAALVLHPYYYKGLMTREVLVTHYHEVADTSPIPIIIYNMPANSGMDLDAGTILAIAKHENIIGLKDSGGNVAKMSEIIHHAKPGFQVLAGSAGFLIPALSVGAVGGIMALANILPEKCINMYKAFRVNQFSLAANLQREVVELNGMVTRGWGVPALKGAMDHLGLYGGPCRKPIQKLSDSQIQTVLQKLTEQL